MKPTKFTPVLSLMLLVLASIFALSACDNTQPTNNPSNNETLKTCQHQWIDADCLYPKTCRICQATEGGAKGHDFVEDACTEPKTCRNCHKTEGEALGHTEVVDVAVVPTCTTKGLTEGKHCSVCNEILVQQIEIDALEHSWQSATCTKPKTCSLCKATEGMSEPHHFVEQIISDEYLCSTATNVSPAKYYYSCTFCKEASTETFEYGSPLLDTWHYDYYIDYQFGYTTDEWYIKTNEFIDGTFENSAVENRALLVELLYDCNDEISIFLYEYADVDNLVKNNSSSSKDYYKIVIRNEKGQTCEARGQMWSGGDRIYIIDIYLDEVFYLMTTSDNLQFFIQDEDFPTTQYRFDVDMNNFNDVLDEILPEDEHIHSYTTSIVESTCLKDGFTLYSCECGYYFCTDFTPLKEHNVEHGMCTECDSVIDVYNALAYYVKCNGTEQENGKFYITIEEEYSSTKTFAYYIYTDSSASTVSFHMLESDASSSPSVTLITLNLNHDNYHEVIMEFHTSAGSSYCWGEITNTFSGSKSEIYNYEYDLAYTTSALIDSHKKLFASDIVVMLCGLELYLLPNFATLPSLGFTNI